jgi:hypothetical protein
VAVSLDVHSGKSQFRVHSSTEEIAFRQARSPTCPLARRGRLRCSLKRRTHVHPYVDGCERATIGRRAARQQAGAATISMHVVAHFAPWIALSITDNDERERFIAEIVRMLSTWVGAQQ